ncbi:DUF4230 domain-containing protein [Croceivirga sp. JEA036]|uniref:DUF4230 domain-containing protein n=1 Tax=Croceivirga sp. JEA036 TaxID=2721162 RepID=UPI001439145E|nr:DUF4230 domain-containing protein [Croceivirga sp. JEA036]NJB37839.1 DUF4230 domain-containing protein [Croceivirga sp. JEA036]
MKKVLAGIIVALAVVFIYNSYRNTQKERSILKENSMLIEQQIAQVSKLIVTEGHFAEVYNYKDSKELFGPLVTAEKKALVVVNADVEVVFDLKQVSFTVDEEAKTVQITHIPEPEIKLHPDFEYYDVTQDYLNPFAAADYNNIKKNVKASLLKKVEASTLYTNANNRLVSELSKLLVLTNSMGWTLVYQDQTVTGLTDLEQQLKD